MQNEQEEKTRAFKLVSTGELQRIFQPIGGRGFQSRTPNRLLYLGVIRRNRLAAAGYSVCVCPFG